MFFAGSSKRQISLNDHNQVEQILQHLAVIVEQSTEGVVVVNHRGVVHFVNAAWARMHGFQDAAGLLNKSIGTFHGRDAQDDLSAFLKTAARKGEMAVTLKHKRRGGAAFDAQTRAIALKDDADKVIGLVILATDLTQCVQTKDGAKRNATDLAGAMEDLQGQITEREQAEEKLRGEIAELTAANEQLQHRISEQDVAEEELKQKAAELTAANERLKRQTIARKLAEERLEQLTGALTTVSEQFKHQITEHEQANEQLKEQITDLTAAYKQFGQQAARHGQAKGAASGEDEDEEASGRLVEPFDTEKLEAVADLAKRLT